MSQRAAHHHKKAAHHHERAAEHHHNASQHYAEGNMEDAAHSAQSARGHALHAADHANEASKHHAHAHDQQEEWQGRGEEGGWGQEEGASRYGAHPAKWDEDESEDMPRNGNGGSHRGAMAAQAGKRKQKGRSGGRHHNA